MTLSVCCLTSDPGARVSAILRQLRPVADEIVVAVDSRLDPERLGRYADVADRLLRYEFVDSAEQAAPWLTAQCTGDWILRIDGDEVMDPALIERLPGLIRARDVFQYWLPCRWLFPDADHYLAQPPWHFSGSRLVRNDPATIWHQGLSHGGFEAVFPSVHLSESFYHLSLLVHDRAYREAKVARYMSIASGHSRSVLETDLAAFYLPEQDQRFNIAAVPVPARDRAAIAEVLAASGEELPGPSPEEIPMWSWSKIQRVWPRRTLAEDAYRGEIEMFERAPRLYGGQGRQVTVRVRNTGAEHWPGLNREPRIKLSHRWLAPEGPADGEWTDTWLPAGMAPGASALVPMAIEAPAIAGRHALELSLVHEDLLRGCILRRFAGVSLSIEIDEAERNPWESACSTPPMTPPADARAARSLADTVEFWWHSIDLGYGVVTDGTKTPEYLAAEHASLGLPDLQGKAVLDIGAWDGFYSFACERAGAARVVALDHFVWSIDLPVYQQRYREAVDRGLVTSEPDSDPELWRPDELPGKRGFDVARAALGSDVEAVVADFQRADLDAIGRFDVVLFLGVIYHMRDPLEALRRLLRLTGELAIIESEAFALRGAERRPLFEFVGGGGRLGDPTNWWIPNRRGLEQLCLAAGFARVEHVSSAPPEPTPGALTRMRTVMHAWR
jgi:tRNA (mo5U34)-methyltransferase